MSDLLIQLWEKGILLNGTWKTVYMTFISAFFSYLIGLPLGVILNVTAKDGMRPILVSVCFSFIYSLRLLSSS